ncbi:MAG: hypothetical protein JZU65_23645 [Chlorobium sp.]|nr:hypothetical protein [Chlorobium sp.]
MPQTKIIDTNVVLVANGQHQDVSDDCVKQCALQLQAIMRRGRIAMDDGFLILREYQHKTQPKRGNRPGDAFVKWALRNNANQERCDLVPLQEDRDRGFSSFPDDPELTNFDDPDRKFVAVAAAHSQHPPIVQAADSKWLDWNTALNRYGIQVDFICQADIQRFHQRKFGT